MAMNFENLNNSPKRSVLVTGASGNFILIFTIKNIISFSNNISYHNLLRIHWSSCYKHFVKSRTQS